MSYTPHTWTDGETITAAKMNAIEEGIEGAASGGGGDGYDAIIYYDNACIPYPVVTATFADIKGKMEDGDCPRILYESYYSSGANNITCVCVLLNYVNWYGSRGWLHLEGAGPEATIMLGWNENDEVFYDD